MPIYEFKCHDCQKKFELLVGINENPADQPCPNCHSINHSKLVSRFRRMRSEDDRVDAIADELETMNQPETAGQMRSFIQEMGRATDDDMSEELEEMFESDLESESSGDPTE